LNRDLEEVAIEPEVIDLVTPPRARVPYEAEQSREFHLIMVEDNDDAQLLYLAGLEWDENHDVLSILNDDEEELNAPLLHSNFDIEQGIEQEQPPDTEEMTTKIAVVIMVMIIVLALGKLLI
jgi:hypothetical protein